ncbi:hypothetical protein SAMN05216282_102145 [Cryobacterium psychrotolerans]|uniref:Uncharacterized protein n=1 Tax=Cryobacterium psychrotolerans TaxID=386301 RepID=A0A1G8YII9_9MICO|nr:hypothetical protein SAMN05216282_102145 [Cryobacterium psychrotolerans]
MSPFMIPTPSPLPAKPQLCSLFGAHNEHKCVFAVAIGSLRAS